MNTHAPYLSSTFFFFFPTSASVSLCLWLVSSPIKTYPVAGLSLNPLLDKQVVSQPDRLSDERQLWCLTRQKKKKEKMGRCYTTDS